MSNFNLDIDAPRFILNGVEETQIQDGWNFRRFTVGVFIEISPISPAFKQQLLKFCRTQIISPELFVQNWFSYHRKQGRQWINSGEIQMDRVKYIEGFLRPESRLVDGRINVFLFIELKLIYQSAWGQVIMLDRDRFRQTLQHEFEKPIKIISPTEFDRKLYLRARMSPEKYGFISNTLSSEK